MKRKILFVLPGGYSWGARRTLDYGPMLVDHGWEWTTVKRTHLSVLRLYSNVQRRAEVHRWLVPARKAAGAILIGDGWLNLVRAIARARSHDVVFLQAVVPPVVLTRLLRRLNHRIVFDIDDAIFLNEPKPTAVITEVAAVAAAGSHYNAEFITRHRGDAVFLPTPVPLDDFRRARERRLEREQSRPAAGEGSDLVRIGWVGTVATVMYLEVITDALERLGAELPGRIQLTVVGADVRADLIPRLAGVEVQVVPWVEAARIPDIVAGLDIGVMPLFDREWERGKCALKALEYMAAGVPAVCSAVGENTFVIDDGRNGFLASSNDEWVDKLRRLVLDADLRRRLGDEGQRTIAERYSTDACFATLRDQVLEPALHRGTNPR